MAVYNIYRESWQKSNGWNVRVEFVPCGGEARKYGDRSVTAIQGVFKDVSGHKAGFGDILPLGIPDGESCRFVIDYSACPSIMQTALQEQYRSIDSERIAVTPNKYRVRKYMIDTKQPNLFMIWSDRGTSNGIAKELSISYSGAAFIDGSYSAQATSLYFPGAMDTRTGSGLTIDYTVTGGYIVDVTVHDGGTGYKVGDQVKIEDPLVEDRYAYFTVTSVQDPTWSLEFAGTQRISPSTKYKDTPRGLEIEIEAIGVHKVALESIVDLTTFTTLYMVDRVDSASGGNYYYGAREAVFDNPTSSDYGIFDFDYYRDMKRWSMYSLSKLSHWHAPLTALFEYVNEAFDEAIEFYMMEGYQGIDSTSNIDTFYPRTDSKLKLMRAKTCDGTTNNDLGEADGDMHGTAAELTEIRFIYAVTRDNVIYSNPEFWVGGLFTDFDDGIKKDADSAWDLLRKLCEQFFIKANPYWELTSGLFKAKWYVGQAYSTEIFGSIKTLSYDDTLGDAEFEANAETREAVKQHYYVNSDDIEEVEVTSYTKSGKKVEANHIFDIRYRTAPLDTEWTIHTLNPVLHKSIEQTSARLRGLFQIKPKANGALPAVNPSGIINMGKAGLLNLSPQVTLSYLSSGDATYTSYTASNPYEYTADPNNGNFVFYKLEAPAFSGSFSNQLLRLQTADAGFRLVANVIFSYFGFGALPNNQTMYDMELPLSVNTLARNIGHRTGITKHPDAGSVSQRAYLVELEIDWTAKDSRSSFVKAKYLTRSYPFG